MCGPGGDGGDGGATIGADFGVVDGQFSGASTGGTGTSIGGAPSGSTGGIPGGPTGPFAGPGSVAGNVSTSTPSTVDSASETVQQLAAIAFPMPMGILYGGSKGLEALGAQPTPATPVGDQAGGPGATTVGGRRIVRQPTQVVETLPEVEEELDLGEDVDELAELDELNRIKRLIGAEQATKRYEWEQGRLGELGLRDSVVLDPAERFMEKRSSLERKYGLPPFYGAAK